MMHPIHCVVAFEPVASYTLRVRFEDGTLQVIDFRPVLKGGMYGALRDPNVFDRVRIDPEVQTLVWPNGADFDPATLYDWPRAGKRLEELSRNWAGSSAA